MKEVLFQIKKKGIAAAMKRLRYIKRRTLKNSLTIEESYFVPIVINNRNRYTYLKDLIDWLKNAGYNNIIVLDNDSTYQPLLDYYKTIPAKVIFLKKNIGYMALWESDVFEGIKKGFYVYTDPDVIPNKNCPNDIVYKLYTVLSKYDSIEKAGAALLINDLPDQYKNKEAVIKDESLYWLKTIGENILDAPVDTTFALYKPLAFGNSEQCKAYRIAGNYSFHHLPWYEDSLNPTIENKFYTENIKQGTTVWSAKNK